ncbi:aKG-HExxH-type peptide beta-hydroxylase [Actinomadura sp. 9N215]|uniref:aKG-HExxH-type peptide beta-hydroxylase n=1 Tax=Actinomadura sp. 9N215 TaxID=3375150 RepID=UPI0037BB8F8E
MELHWKPDPERARLERAALSLFIGQQLEDRLGWDADELSAELDGDLAHPAMFVALWSMVEGKGPRSSRDEVVQTVRESRLRAAEGVWHGTLAVDLVPPEQTVLAPTLIRAREMTRRIDGTPQTFTFHHPDRIGARDQIFQVRELISDCWPEMLAELETTVSCLAFFTAGAAIGFADVQTHGLIALRRQDLSNVTILAEEIIHESSHVRLNGIMSSTECLLDDGGRLYTTPLRKDPRPAPGLLHQFFVLARLREWQSRLGAEAIPERVERQRKQLIFAYDVVNKDLPLTDAGRELVSTVGPVG